MADCPTDKHLVKPACPIDPPIATADSEMDDGPIVRQIASL